MHISEGDCASSFNLGAGDHDEEKHSEARHGQPFCLASGNPSAFHSKYPRRRKQRGMAQTIDSETDFEMEREK
jgi:hypothetical protein